MIQYDGIVDQHQTIISDCHAGKIWFWQGSISPGSFGSMLVDTVFFKR